MQHSILLIPALERLGEVYADSFYYDEDGNKEGDVFINNKCAREHLRFYPAIMDLYEQHQNIRKERKAQKARDHLHNQILEKLKREFGETVVNGTYLLLNTCPETYVDVRIASLIVDAIIHGAPLQTNVWKDEMSFYNSYLGRGNEHFRAKVRDFVEREISDESLLILAAEVKRSEEEASRIKINLRELVRKLIAKIKHGRPLKGKCEICSKSSF